MPPITLAVASHRLFSDQKRWGYKFRFGVFKIDDHDLELIRETITG